MAGRMINGAAALADLIRTAEQADEPGIHRILPVVPELGVLLPGRGLRRGSTVSIAAAPSVSAPSVSAPSASARPGAAPVSGSSSLMLALLAAASRAGSWCAIAGLPAVAAPAAAESGIALDRLALVPNPGPDWPAVVAALIDGVDVVVVAVPGPVAPSIASRLVARARRRGTVLMPFGSWSGADVTLQVMAGRWEGLGHGHGRLRRRTVTVTARGRGAAARPRETTLWMPGISFPPAATRIPPAPAEPPGSLTPPGSPTPPWPLRLPLSRLPLSRLSAPHWPALRRVA